MPWSPRNTFKQIAAAFSKRRNAKPSSPAGKVSHRAARLQVEELETRCLMTGTWTPLAQLVPSPAGTGTMMLLSDGTVLTQGGAGTASSSWYKLTPNSAGSYINGTWSVAASMGLERLYFASQVLKTGKVLVVGGEYSGPATTQNLTNTGEIYDPVANSWTPIADFPQAQFGDDPSSMLPDGRVLTGYIFGPQTYIYNPTNNTWTQAGTKLRNDASDEETWVKLPDNSILTYDVFASGHAQRYIPSLNQWVDAGNVPVALETPALNSAALRLPDGRIFFIGGNSNTAFYTPPTTPLGTGTWTAGPVIPGGLGANDAPSAILPNGHILMAVSGTPDFGPPPGTTIYEFDPIANTYTDVTPAAANLGATPAFVERMVLLPSGQVLFTDSDDQLFVYTPDGAPKNAWRPVIKTITNVGNNVYTMTGTQLNGLSEGASYGDDAEMSSNYPIVRITNKSGQVFYARTFNWSSTGVATGSTIVSTQFVLPFGRAILGSDTIVVIANGIPSLPFNSGKVNVFSPIRWVNTPDGIYSGYLTVVNNTIGDFTGPSKITFTVPQSVTVIMPPGAVRHGNTYTITINQTLQRGVPLHIRIQVRNPLHVYLGTYYFGFPAVFTN